jgi:four helix bundle protein
MVARPQANEVKKKVYAITARKHIARDLEYCQQIRESARSAPSNIAVGFGRYRPAEFARFLEYARGSLTDMQITQTKP